MTIGSVLSPPMAYPAHQDPNQTLYGFHCDVWEESPSPAFGQDWFPHEERFRRDANANAYRQYGNPIAWNRYITLGYFALEDCVEFDQLWKNFDKDPLAVHRVIWYQFMYHVDRDMPIPERLSAWAMNVSHAYLEYHDATSLAMDTLVKWKSQEFNTSMDTEPTDDPWIPVVATRRSRNKSPPAPPIASNNTTQSRKPPGTMHELPNRKVNQNPQTAMLKDWSRYQKLVRPASRPPNVSTVPEDEDEDVNPIDPDAHVDNGSGSLQGSLATPAPHRPSSFPTIAVNDGSHRLTFKWSVPNRIQAYERDKKHSYGKCPKCPTNSLHRRGWHDRPLERRRPRFLSPVIQFECFRASRISLADIQVLEIHLPARF
ncbi:hypothetical protein MHU86_22424 [Fragilaria crotonensis]|nr:hypothetical protein MHU86_22424 [Fragilaria crotonensis]